MCARKFIYLYQPNSVYGKVSMEFLHSITTDNTPQQSTTSKKEGKYLLKKIALRNVYTKHHTIHKYSVVYGIPHVTAVGQEQQAEGTLHPKCFILIVQFSIYKIR